MSDPYLNLIDEQWDNITKTYDVFRKKKPIIEYNLDDNKIYAYPAMEYINSLSVKTKNELKNKYMKVCDNNEFLLLIRDEKNKKFRSYTFEL